MYSNSVKSSLYFINATSYCYLSERNIRHKSITNLAEIVHQLVIRMGENLRAFVINNWERVCPYKVTQTVVYFPRLNVKNSRVFVVKQMPEWAPVINIY